MILNADARSIPLTDGSVHCVVTSPPYWGLRDYGMAGQLGLERTPEEYVAAMVTVFREVWRVLRDNGTLWLNLGDSYAGSWSGNSMRPNGGNQRPGGPGFQPLDERVPARSGNVPAGLKPKDLVGVPWRVAFALQADGWYLRSDIIWSKPNPMPESVTDRPTKSHEYLFLLSKKSCYYYDSDAIREPRLWPDGPNGPDSIKSPYGQGFTRRAGVSRDDYEARKWDDRSDGLSRPPMTMRDRQYNPAGRNRRSVWEIATQPYSEAHFATFPEALVEPCILAGTSERGACAACGAPWERVVERAGYKFNGTITLKGEAREAAGLQSVKTGLHEPGWCDQERPYTTTTGWQPTCACTAPTTRPLVLDPFAGSGTVGLVCHRLGRRFVGLELKEEYCAMAAKRTAQLGLV